MEREVKIFAQLPQQKIELIGSLSEADYPLIRNRIVGHTQGGTKELVTELLLKAKWVLERDERNIFIPVIETFMQIPGINLKKLSEFVKNKEKQTFFTKYLESKKTFNLYEMFQQNLEGVFSPESLKQLVDQLWTITTCVKQVGVGPGEICLSLLTDAQKGNKGDLLITEVGDVEVKSSRGRIGTGNNALSFAKNIEKHFQIIPDPKDSWNGNVQYFFYNFYNLKLSDLSKALTFISTEELNNEQVENLSKGIQQIILKHKIIEGFKNKDRQILAQLIFAIQLACYQQHQKFLYLLTVNKETMEAYPFYFEKTLANNVISIYDQIVKINRFRIELDIDRNGTRKGIAISLK